MSATLLSLPLELLFKTLSYLPAHSVAHVASLNHHFHILLSPLLRSCLVNSKSLRHSLPTSPRMHHSPSHSTIGISAPPPKYWANTLQYASFKGM